MFKQEAAELAQKTKHNVSRRIAEKRLEMGFTQMKLAELIGTATRTVSMWECGRMARNAIDHLSLLAVAFRCPINDFFDDATLPKFKRGRPKNCYGRTKTSLSDTPNGNHRYKTPRNLHILRTNGKNQDD